MLALFSGKNRFVKGANRLKKAATVLFLILTVAVFILLAKQVLAQASFGLETADATGLAAIDLKLLIVKIVRIILGFLGIIAVLINLYAGYIWMMSQGEADEIDKAKRILLNGVIGLVIIASSYLIVSYVIGRMTSVMNPEDLGANQGNNYSVNGFALGAGALDAVYPEPGATGLPRNTLIMTTFKEIIDLASVINPAPNLAACAGLAEGHCGYLKTYNLAGGTVPAIKIINRSDNNFVLAADQVVVSTNDAKTFVLDPVAYLGTNGNDSNYSVNLTDQIKKENNSPAFLPGGYVWSFGVSGVLDFIPPYVINVRPVGENPVPQNTVVQLEFSEAINPVSATGHATGNPNEVFNNILIKYTDANNQEVYLSGDAVISNRFRTIEFKSAIVCQMPAGQQVNSCGEVPTCFPPDESFNLIAKAAAVNDNGETTNLMSGITDAAGNSLDGNANGTSQGPAADNYSSVFNTSNELDLTPPEISSVAPVQGNVMVAPNSQINASFNEVLLSSSVNSEAYRIFEYACNGDDFPAANYCYPVGGFAAYGSGSNASISVYYPYLDPLKQYNPRLNEQIKDLYQNCFNPAQGLCAAGQDSPICH